MQFRLIAVWRYKMTVYRQNTNIKMIYVYASERGKIMHFYISNLVYKLV